MEERKLIELTADIAAAYVSGHKLPADELPSLLQTIHAALKEPGGPEPRPASPKLTAAAIRRSVQPDGLVSFIDGRSYKHLKRHLAAHGLTPETYREQFGLPSDYPLVAPAYSAMRSQIAHATGLGRTVGGRGRSRAKGAKTR